MNALRSARAYFVLVLLMIAGMFSTAEVARAATPRDLHIITPCRVVDSRITGGALTAGPVRDVNIPAACGIPDDVVAIIVNLTVVSPPSSGYIQVFKGGTTPPEANVLTFDTGDILGQFFVVEVGTTPDLQVRLVMGPGSTHFVIDVLAYHGSGAPSDIVLSNNTVLENEPVDTLVGTLSTTDPDFDDTHTYTLVAGTGDTDNLKFKISGDQVLTDAVLDRETQQTYSIRVRSTDNFGVFSEEVFTIEATNENEAPVLTAGGVLNYSEGDPATAIDTGLTITDDSTNLQSATVQITGNYQNGQDVLSFVNTATITAGAFDTTTGTLTLTGTDTVASWQTALRNVLYSNTSENPSTLQRTVTWIATDDGALSSTGVTSSISLSSTNSQPTITAIDNQTIDEDTSTSALAFTVGDAETAAGSLTVTGSSSNQALIPDANIVFGGSGASRTVTVTPAAHANGGPVTITITVNDGSGAPNSTNTETFDVTITAVNDQPTITAIDDQVIDEDTSTSALAFTVGDQETAAGSLTVTVSSSDQAIIPDANVVLGGANPNRTVTVTPAPNASGGPVTITITVNDGSGAPNATVTETFNVTVTAVNDQPTISDVTDQVVNEDTPTSVLPVTVGDLETAVGALTLSGTSSDQSIVPNANIVFGGSGANRTVTVTPAADANGGPVTITITVNDGSGAPNATASDTFNLTVNAVNDNPTVTAIADQTIDEDTSTGPLAFTIGDVDTAIGSLTITATSSDQTLIPNANVVLGGAGTSRTVTVTPAPNQFGGPVTITVTVDDGGGSPAVETFTVTVTSVNDQPTITGIANQTIDEDTSTSALAFTIGDIETAAGTLTVSGSSSNETLIPSANIVIGGSGANRTVTVTPAANQFGGPVTITITVNDGSGAGNATNSTTFTVTVNSVNDQPTITGIANQTIDEDTSTGPLAFTIGDIETAAGSLLVSGASDNTTIIPNGNIVFGGSGASRTVTITPAANQFGGPVTITITVNDGSGQPNATNTAVFTVTVNPVNDAPVLTNATITYSTPGNTQLHVEGKIRPGLAAVTDSQGADAKAGPITDIDGPAGPFIVDAAGATTNGGSYDIDADGSFHYVPPVGFTGTDSFNFQVTDTVDPVQGTVNITVGQRVWYVRDLTDGNNPSGGDGRSTDAFDSIAALNAATTNNGDIIFIFEGNTATTPLTGSIALRDGQKLHGHGIGLTVPGFSTLVAAGNRPRIRTTTATTDVVTVPATAGNRSNVEIRGLDLEATGATSSAIDVTASGANTVGVTISNNNIRGATAEGIDLNSGATAAFSVTLQNNTVTSANNGIDARVSATGTATVTASSNMITSTAGSAIDIRTLAGASVLRVALDDSNVAAAATGILIDGLAAGTTTITSFSNNSVDGSTVGTGISVTSAIFDGTPGGTFQAIAAGSTGVGASGNGVGQSGMVLTNVQGDLTFGSLNIFADGGAGLRASSSTAYTGSAGLRLTATGATAIIEATGGPVVDVAQANLNFDLGAIKSTNSPTTGLALNSVTGSFASASGSSITNITSAAGTAFQVGNSSATVTFPGTITTSQGKGVDLTSNSGATINLTGALTLSSGTNTAFNATGGGTVAATNTSSTLTTTTATALNVANTTIGAGGLKFQRISSNGGGNSGIVLNNTGSAGGLAVGGNGGTCTSAATCTGGAIQNKTVDGISLNNTRSVSLTRMFIDNNDGSGIFGDDVTDFSLISSVVSNNADTTTGAEAGLRFNELLGNCAITNSTISGSSEDEIRITPASGVLTNLAISGTTIGPNNATTGGNGITFSPTVSADATLTVTGGVFQNIRSSALLVNGDGTTRRNVTVSGATFRDNNSGVHVLGSFSADLTFEVTGNTFLRHGLNPIQVVIGSTSTNAMQVVGEINGNVIGDGTPNSGATDLHGIAVEINGDADAILSITNNSVSNTDIDGIFVQTRLDNDADAETGRLDLTLRDNDVNTPDDNSAFPFGAAYGTRVESRNTTTICLDVAGNSSASVGGLEHFRVRQRDTSTFIMERLTDGDGTPGELITNLATVEAFLVGQNDAGSTADATQQTVATGFTEAANGFCRKP